MSFKNEIGNKQKYLVEQSEALSYIKWSILCTYFCQPCNREFGSCGITQKECTHMQRDTTLGKNKTKLYLKARISYICKSSHFMEIQKMFHFMNHIYIYFQRTVIQIHRFPTKHLFCEPKLRFQNTMRSPTFQLYWTRSRAVKKEHLEGILLQG